MRARLWILLLHFVARIVVVGCRWLAHTARRGVQRNKRLMAEANADAAYSGTSPSYGATLRARVTLANIALTTHYLNGYSATMEIVLAFTDELIHRLELANAQLDAERAAEAALLPGTRTRTLLSWVFSPRTIESMFDPLLADLHHEWNEARTINSEWWYVEGVRIKWLIAISHAALAVAWKKTGALRFLYSAYRCVKWLLKNLAHLS